jgi:hypothetical protein
MTNTQAVVVSDLPFKPYVKDLPPLDSDYAFLVELVDKDSGKRKLVGCGSEARASQFA